VPERAHAGLDLCTGSGTSLTGLRMPGRLVIGVDVSLGMLEVARDAHGRTGWAPRLLAADGFHLPLRDGSLDAITVAFGIRNLRPRDQALREIRRVLKPGGTLAVLEATAPSPGPLAAFHRFYLAHVLPRLGRLSPDPSAYAYLARSILEFGPGESFDVDLAREGFAIDRRRSFLLGASRLWSAHRVDAGVELAGGDVALQAACDARDSGGRMPTATGRRAGEWWAWTVAQCVVAAAIFGLLAWALWTLEQVGPSLVLKGSNVGAMRAVTWVGLVGFGARTLLLIMRLMGGPPRG
jgi:demethylmenaquinone methyltransferase/2-methoxy-6-polyprenyl-1,4-benzoquinol methylase